MRAHLEEPLGGVAEQLQLVDRLPGAVLAQLRRAVGGEQEQRHPRLVRLDGGRQELGGGRPGGAGDGHRESRGLGQAEREEARAALVDVREAAQALLARERQHERRAARPRRRACGAHPAARELIDERSQQQVGVRGGAHGGPGGGVRAGSARRACERGRTLGWPGAGDLGSVARLRRHPAQLGRRHRRIWTRNATCRWRSTCPGTAMQPPANLRSRSPVASSTSLAALPRALRAVPATRSAGASRCRSRWRRPSACAARAGVHARPASRMTAERRAAPRATTPAGRRARERIRSRSFIERWRAPAAVRR